jgi:hypothetical protein
LSHLTFKCELLEGIGVISKVKGKKAVMCSGNYQDNVTTPLSREHDNNAVGDDEDDEDDESVADMPDADTETADVNAADGVLPAIGRVRNGPVLYKPTNCNILVSFGKSSSLSVQVPNVVNLGLVRSSLSSLKEAGC